MAVIRRCKFAQKFERGSVCPSTFHFTPHPHFAASPFRFPGRLSTQLVGGWGIAGDGGQETLPTYCMGGDFTGRMGGRLQMHGREDCKCRVGMGVSGGRESEVVGAEGIITELTTGFFLRVCVSITQNTRHVL